MAAGLGSLVGTLQYNSQLMCTPGTASPLHGDKKEQLRFIAQRYPNVFSKQTR